MTSTTTYQGTTTTTTTGTTCSVNAITTPGCYVCNWNGALLRVNENCFDGDGNCYFSFCCKDNLTVTFLCDDSSCSTAEARNIASRSGCPCNF